MNRLVITGFCLCMLAAILRADNPPAVLMPPTGKPNFINIDSLVLNLNAVAGIHYNANGSGGNVTVTYLNGNTASYYNLKLSPSDWSKLQPDIVSAGNR